MPKEEAGMPKSGARAPAGPAKSSNHRIEELIGALLADENDLDVDRRDALEMRLYLGYYDLPDVRQMVAERLAASTAPRSHVGRGDRCKKKGRSPREPGQEPQKEPIRG